jgi:hypothetical protein
MSRSVKTLSTLKERLTTFKKFINAHKKMITKYIIPILDEAIAASSQYIANVEGASFQPLFSENKEAGMRLAVKGNANLLRELFDKQMVRLRDFETVYLVATGFPHMTDNEAIEYVGMLQSPVVKNCRNHFHDLFKILDLDVDAEKTCKLEGQQIILKSYLVEAEMSDENVIGLLIRWSERDAAAASEPGVG